MHNIQFNNWKHCIENFCCTVSSLPTTVFINFKTFLAQNSLFSLKYRKNSAFFSQHHSIKHLAMLCGWLEEKYKINAFYTPCHFKWAAAEIKASNATCQQEKAQAKQTNQLCHQEWTRPREQQIWHIGAGSEQELFVLEHARYGSTWVKYIQIKRRHSSFDFAEHY